MSDEPTMLGHTCTDVYRMEEAARLLEKLEKHPEFARIKREATVTPKEKAFSVFLSAVTKEARLDRYPVPVLLRRGFNAGWEARKRAEYEATFSN